MDPDKNEYILTNSTIMKNIVKFFVHVALLYRLLMLHCMHVF